MILNSIHNAGVARWRAARPTNGLRSNGNGIMENRITNSQEIIGERGEKIAQQQHKKKNQLYFANGDSRKKKRLRQVFAGTNTSQI